MYIFSPVLSFYTEIFLIIDPTLEFSSSTDLILLKFKYFLRNEFFNLERFRSGWRCCSASVGSVRAPDCF